MLRRSLLSLTPLALLRASAPPPCPSYFAKGLQARWSASRDYTLAVLDKMPDEHFGFRPMPEEWTFSQQLTHIADGNLLIAAPLRGDKPVYVVAPARQLPHPPERTRPPPPPGGDKKPVYVVAPPRQLAHTELKQHLEHSFGYVAEAF